MPFRGNRIDPSKYKRVNTPKGKDEEEPKPANEIRVGKNDDRACLMKTCIKLLQEDNHKTITIKGLGAVVSNAIVVAEMVKRRVKGLHQIATLVPTTIVDRYQLIEAPKEGEEPVEDKTVERTVHLVSILLSVDPLDETAVGYQAPLPEEEVDEGASLDAFSDRKRGGGKGAFTVRGRGVGYPAIGSRRGGRGGGLDTMRTSGREGGGGGEKGGGKGGHPGKGSYSKYHAGPASQGTYGSGGGGNSGGGGGGNSGGGGGGGGGGYRGGGGKGGGSYSSSKGGSSYYAQPSSYGYSAPEYYGGYSTYGGGGGGGGGG
eukprot:Rhum_TRINITY_DN15469_c3_g1::Rhum_TRINITY_DN15469_c3_g1_i1::g.158635::m.158635